MFKYDKENSVSFFIDAEDKEYLYGTIIAHKEWFRHEDEKGNLHVVNMQRVTSFNIQEYKPARVVARPF